jgi:heme a synthase
MQLSHGIQLAAIAILLALLPLGWVWIAKDSNKYRKLVWVTLFFTFDLIVFGAFTRLTDSGLGCPDWPGCYSHANPLQVLEKIDAAAALMPTGPVTRVKAWIEMIHRYLAMMIGIMIMILMAGAWRVRYSGSRSQSPRLPTLLFLLVCVQGAFGAWTVTLKLQPVIVTIHLLLGMLLLAMLAALAARQPRPSGMTPRVVPAQALAPHLRLPALRPWIYLGATLLSLQLALGGWVSTNYAALACRDFPMCNGSWWPEMDFTHGFTLWRELGKTGAGDFLPYAALTAIHWVHRVFALLLAVVLAVLAWRARFVCPDLARALALVLLMQLTTGIATVYFAWPLGLAVLHNAGAALLVLVLSMLHYRATAKD